MYDDLETLGATPDEVEASLEEFGFKTLRLTRSQARQFLNEALDKANKEIAKENDLDFTTNVEPVDEEARKTFIDNILLNNCIVRGSFHYVTHAGQILGCPLTLGFDLSHSRDEENVYPAWGNWFYPRWDSLLHEYTTDKNTSGWVPANVFVLED